MSISFTRSHATDSYEILTSYTSTSSNTEVDIVSSLVKGLSDTSENNVFESIDASHTSDFNYTRLNPEYVDTSTISNYPSGSVTKNSVISLEHIGSGTPQNYSVSLNIDGSTNSQDFSLLGTSAALYDSNYVFTQSYLPSYYNNGVLSENSEFDINDDTFFKAEFDLSNSYNPAQQAVNTRWNSILPPYNNGLDDAGIDPIQIAEDINFNQSLAFGMAGTGATDDSYVSMYASSSSVDGLVTFTPIDDSYQLVENNLVVSDRIDSSFNIINDVGIFKFQQNLTDSIKTSFVINDASGIIIGENVEVNGTQFANTTTFLNNIPLMDVNGTLTETTQKNELNVPGDLNNDLNVLFNPDVLNTISENYKFYIEVSDASGGYYIDGDHPLTSVINNDDIHDNPFYMANYVNVVHNIMFSAGEIIVEPSSNDVSVDNSGNLDFLTFDLTDGETLTSDYAGNNGVIKINTNSPSSRTTDVSFVDMTGTEAHDISVLYSGANEISDAMRTSPYLHVNYDKVVLRSSVEPSANVFLSSNDAFLTMYTDTNKIVNNKLDATYSDFSFNKILFNDDSIRLWRLNTENILATDPESFYSGYDDASNVGINLINGICVSSVLENLTENLVYDSYRCELTAKHIQDLSLYEAVQDASTNWSIIYSDDSSNNFLKSNSSQAFNHLDALPNYDNSLINRIASGTSLNYSYEYITQTDKSTYGGLVDYVQVTYTDASNTNTFKIPETDLNKVYHPDLSEILITPVDASYSLPTSGPYTREQWRLVYVERTSVFDVDFNPNFGPFSNITLQISSITQINRYYALQSKTKSNGNNNGLAPSQALTNVSNCSIANLTTITETMSTPTNGTFRIDGTLTVSDLKPYLCVVQAKQVADDGWVNISNNIDFDTYYSIGNLHILDISGATIVTKCEYDPFRAEQQNVELNLGNYYIPFIYESNNTFYSLSSFISTADDLSSKTNLSSSNSYFTVSDNYACTEVEVNPWNNYENYSIDVSDFSNNVTEFTVSDASQNVVFKITKQSNSIFLGTQIITYIPNDIWRSRMNLGESDSSNNFSENYESIEYHSPNNTIRFENVPGIEVNVASTTYDIGCGVSFRVLGDFMTINEVGPIANPSISNELGLSSYNNGNLVFQYFVSSNNYSVPFTFNRYRGYAEPVTPGVQTYIIKRGKTSVTFNVGEDLTQLLTDNMYNGKLLTVNELKNDAQITCADLNIKFTTLYSIPPALAELEYPVSVYGDDVTTRIENPDYTGSASNIVVSSNSTPVLDPKYYDVSSNLTVYGRDNMYTFSGANHVAFRPSRVKVYNAAFPYNHFKYSIDFLPVPLFIYKAKSLNADTYSYIGNPTLISDNSVNASVDTTKWEPILTLTSTLDKLNGITIGKKVIKQNANKIPKNVVSYFVSTPPYYKYSCVKTVSGSENPSLYDYESLDHTLKREVYLPFNPSNSIYRPFAETISIKDIIGTSISISNNPATVNDIKFTHLRPRSLVDLTSNNANATPIGIIVPGINLRIVSYSGLYGSSHPHLIYDGPITSIPFTPNVETHQIIFRERDASGAIFFSLAQFLSDIGYDNTSETYQELFKTENESVYYNIDFKLDNVGWFNNNSPVTRFQAQADGIRPTLYTVVDVNNPFTKVNSRRVYKYVSSSSYKIDDDLDTLQTFNFTFGEGRSFYDILVSQPAFSSYAAGEIWNYSNLLYTTDVSSVSWNLDGSFNETVYVSWAFGNSITGARMPFDLFYLDNEATKWVYITLLPFNIMKDQFGLTTSETAWDGSLYTPLVTTRVVSLKPRMTSPVLNGLNYQTELYSISSLH